MGGEGGCDVGVRRLWCGSEEVVVWEVREGVVRGEGGCGVGGEGGCDVGVRRLWCGSEEVVMWE